MQRIAKCESGARQYAQDGSVLRGYPNPDDIGYFQINKKAHLEESKRLKMDIYSLKGNIEFAMYLYKNQGLEPWKYSKQCWSK
jgi:hypothetical protein